MGSQGSFPLFSILQGNVVPTVMGDGISTYNNAYSCPIMEHDHDLKGFYGGNLKN